MATKVERWEYDGRLYETEGQADYAEEVDEIIDYMDDHPLFVSQKGKIQGKEIILWLRMSCPRIFMKLLPEDQDGD